MTAINSNRAIRGPVTAVPVVAGKGVRLVADTENNRWVVEADETVLWEGTPASTMVVSETLKNFERIRFKVYIGQGYQFCECGVKDQDTALCIHLAHGYSNAWNTQLLIAWDEANLTLTVSHSKSLATSFTTNSTTLSGEVDTHKECIYEIVGVNRIASA